MTPQTLSNTSRLRLRTRVNSGSSIRPVRTVSMAEVIPFSKDEVLFPVYRDGEVKGIDDDQKIIVQEGLRRLLRSPLLVQSDRLSRFLSFAVEATLRGDASSLKEYTIGVEAYGRRPDFDPSQDSIVRTEARRLRTKLKKYYQEEGGNDPVLIEFQPGSYVPAFRINRSSNSPASSPSRLRPEGANEFAISVVPFEFLSGDAFGESCARGLTDEVMHSLSRASGIAVFAPSSVPATYDNPADRRTAFCITSDGIVRTEGRRIRVTSRLCDADGLHVASWRFDAEANHDELFGALEKIASEIVSGIEKLRTIRMAC